MIGPTCWNQWSAASQTADDAECRRSTHHKHQEVPADNTRPALVVSPSEDRELKTALLVYRCVHGLASSYLAVFYRASSDQPGHSRLWSASLYRLHVPRTRTKIGDRSFSVNGPIMWNSLSVDLRAPDMSLDTFKLKLKTLLFKSVCWWCICCLGENCTL